ncbi:MAG: signal peptidase II [Rhodospirillales bacterium]
MTRSRAFLPGLAIAGVVIVLDQLSKWWVVAVVMSPPRTIEITPFFNLVMAWNRGISFGFFNNDSPVTGWVLPLVASAIVLVLTVWLSRVDRLLLGVALGLIIGGAIGNVIDRLRYGAVADFLDFHVLGVHWPAFNVADAAITIGAAVLIFDSLFVRSESGKRKPGKQGKKQP